MATLRAQYEGLAVIATVETANLDKDTLMAITGDATVDKAGADDFPLGRLVVPAKTADTQGTVETRFKEMVDVEADGAVAAGAFVKLGALNGDVQTVKTWVEGTDSIKRLYGVVWVGAADEGTATVLTF